MFNTCFLSSHLFFRQYPLAPSRRSKDRGIRKKKLELTVEPDKLYVVGAKFDKENSSDVKAYWEPVIVSVSDMPCKGK